MSVLVSTGTFSQHALSKIDKFLSEEFPSDKPGAVVLIARGDSILYKKAFGDTNESMIFQIASMTKQFTAAAIVNLVRNGKLKTSDSLQQYIDFPGKGHTITIDHLLSQTSGIPEFFDIDANEKQLLAKEHTPGELIAYFKDRPVDFVPGSRFAYSNSNYVLLGAVIEKVGGLTYAQYLDDIFFKPLKMGHTSVWYKSKGNIAKGHPDIDIHGSVVYSSGGIVSTVDDLLIWTRSWVKENSALFQEPGYHYGLNIKDLRGSKTIQHGGNLFGFTSSGIYLPTEEVYVCILANSAFRGTEAMADYIASEIIGKPIDVPKKSVPVNSLEGYTGTFKLQNSTRIMTITIVGNMLVLSFPDQPGSAVDVQPTEDDMFESKKVKAKLTFSRDSNGHVNQVEVKQGKGSYVWIKE